MSPTGIDLKVVTDRLSLVESCLADLRALPAESLEDFLRDRRTFPAAESHIRRAVEALFDTARHILGKGFGIGKLEYREIARTCRDKEVADDDALAERFIRLGGFRNRLVLHYEEVTPQELYAVIRDHLGDVESLAAALARSATQIASG
jgi:uncharacterized protein YutE (UPF0331/DUF86 family)